jgi:hypothetical protein
MPGTRGPLRRLELFFFLFGIIASILSVSFRKPLLFTWSL